MNIGVKIVVSIIDGVLITLFTLTPSGIRPGLKRTAVGSVFIGLMRISSYIIYYTANGKNNALLLLCLYLCLM